MTIPKAVVDRSDHSGKPSGRFWKGETMKYHSLLTANNGLNTPSTNPCKLLEFGFLKLGAGETYSADSEERRKAIDLCCRQLDLADRIGALCCVNISGSRGQKWDGPHADNLTDETFGMIVETTREIIDSVKPTRTYFSLETMPWTYPDSAESYLRLIQAIDRERFAAHLDPVNLVCSPQRYYSNAALIRECFAKLGPYIKSCHAKDIILRDTLTTHLDECEPGTGGLDYEVYLQELSKYPDVPLMLEHMKQPEEYQRAGKYIREVASSLNINFN